ncbi:hypothetical protein F8M41_011173 [Gigaspora margarita]|uniref:F-box domain-containing protein n=1 Tax=Gigaspora margarita TaxID=4874 RepID=A0A8H3WZH9_GIGMA|nr:hypothetical protein F8M41_011173 [Gigaspora margarita]
MSFLTLPDECIDKIINCDENKPKDLYKLLLVNKKLYRIVIPLLWRDPFICESIFLKYLSELNKDEQKTLIPQRINFPPTQSYSRCAQYLMKLNLHSLYVACVKLLVGNGFICQCDEFRIVRSVISSIIQMLLRENTKNLKELSLIISKDVPDYPDISVFSSSQPGISNLRSLHLSFENTPVKDNVRIFIENLPKLCSNIREMSFIIRNDDEEITKLLISLIEKQLLHKFTLKCCSASAKRYIDVLGSQKELRYLQLKELDFTRIPENPLNTVSQQCEKLKQITLSDSHGIFNDHNMNNLLDTLGLNRCFNVTTSPDLINITRIY